MEFKVADFRPPSRAITHPKGVTFARNHNGFASSFEQTSRQFLRTGFQKKRLSFFQPARQILCRI
jgi:hypothetical protein